MPTIFSKIISGEIPCYKIAENDNYLAFLDVFPLVKGHVLVVPKKEVDYIFDMEPEHYKGLFEFAQTVSHGIKKAISCKKVGVAVIGLEVPHAHIHLIPMNLVSDMNFANPKMKIEAHEMNEIAKSIKEKL